MPYKIPVSSIIQVHRFLYGTACLFGVALGYRHKQYHDPLGQVRLLRYQQCTSVLVNRVIQKEKSKYIMVTGWLVNYLFKSIFLHYINESRVGSNMCPVGGKRHRFPVYAGCIEITNQPYFSICCCLISPVRRYILSIVWRTHVEAIKDVLALRGPQ